MLASDTVTVHNAINTADERNTDFLLSFVVFDCRQYCDLWFLCLRSFVEDWQSSYADTFFKALSTATVMSSSGACFIIEHVHLFVQSVLLPSYTITPSMYIAWKMYALWVKVRMRELDSIEIRKLID